MKFRFWLMERLSVFVQLARFCTVRLMGYKNIEHGVILERSLTLDKVYPAGVHIGANTLVASHTVILTHEHVKRDPLEPRNPWVTETYIGRNCFIGVGSMILPGVRIGDEVIIGAGSVVVKDVPSNSVAVGNPARVVRQGIKMNNRAILELESLSAHSPRNGD